jgi:uncharacterized protein (AIM24 family)
MMPLPASGAATSTALGSVQVKTNGELVPVTEVALGPNDTIYFEHHILLWMDPTVTISAKVLKGAARRMMAGLPVIVTEAHGPGRIAFSRDGPGQILFREVRPGQPLHVREHQFLFATSGVSYGYYRVKGLASLMFGHSGMWVDVFDGQGFLVLHGHGNVFERTLAPGETTLVEPGAWLYRDASVQMTLVSLGLKAGLLAGSTMYLNQFTGPGRLALQSMTVNFPTAE